MSIDATIRQLVAEEVRRQLAERAPPERGLVTVRDFARARSISPSTVRQAIRDGRLSTVRIGRAVRVPSDAIIAPRAGKFTAVDRARRILGVRG